MSRLRVLVRRLHLWLGVGAGAILVLLGLTGSALVFYQEIDRLLHPEIAQTASGEAPGWDSPVWTEALTTLRAHWPERHGNWRFEVTGQAGPIPVRYQTAGSGHHVLRTMVWLSADGKQILRAQDWGDYLMTWIYDLHMALRLDEAGRRLVGWMGAASFALVLSGLWAWWPKSSWQQAFRYKTGAHPIRTLRDFHKLTGLMSLVVLGALIVTGWMLAWPAETRWVLSGLFGPVTQVAAQKSLPGTGPNIGIAQMLQVAHARLPESRLVWLEVPGSPEGAYMVRVQQPGDPSDRFPHSYVYIDQRSAKILAMQDQASFAWSNKITNWLHPLHDGSAGGLAGRILIFAIGWIPLLLWITGLLRWRHRRKAIAIPKRTNWT